MKGKQVMKNRDTIFPTILLLICWFGFLVPKAFGVVPVPDGGYPGLNTAEGQNALLNLDVNNGLGNTAVAWFALSNNIDNDFNTAVGAGALLFNRENSNTAVGAAALLSNDQGSDNTAVGVAALSNNTEGSSNTATGSFALLSNTTGSDNTANGAFALENNTIGNSNTANGVNALFSNTEGADNTAIGFQALFSNTGGANTAIGSGALQENTDGLQNTASGNFALFSNTTGSSNTADGGEALSTNTTGGGNVAVGFQALINNSTGNFNIVLGFLAGGNVSTANNVIAIGAPAANVSDSCFIGNIREVATQNADAIPVLIDSAGQLGTASSSRRFKHEIRPMDEASEAILGLKPVTFHYKSDTKDTPQFGLIAEEVAEVNPGLVVSNDNGEVYTVRYDAVNAMLLNEFLKEHKRVEELNCRLAEQEAIVAQQKQEFREMIAQQENKIRAVIATVEKQAAKIQKVSTQAETSKARLRVTAVENP
jgi:Chaperone of endosialidase